MSEIETVRVSLSVDELRYVIACGAALLQNIPESSLPTYTRFTKQEIVDFSAKMRDELNRLGLDM